ncbi:MAG: hypothetical protein HYT16_01465 [DPANN group archaeon]|nr:hypothetical protein [DPANN group archaeon]
MASRKKNLRIFLRQENASHFLGKRQQIPENPRKSKAFSGPSETPFRLGIAERFSWPRKFKKIPLEFSLVAAGTVIQMVKKAGTKATAKTEKGETMSESQTIQSVAQPAAPTVPSEGGGAGAAVRKALKIILGVVVVLLGLGLLWWWFGEFALVFKGMIGIVVGLVGLVIIAIGWTD